MATENGNGSNGVDVVSRAERLLAALGSAAVGRRRFAERAGLQYGSARDIFKVAGYIATGAETFEHYYGLYERDGLAGKIVDMPASTTWKLPPAIIEPGKQDEPTPFMKDFEAMAKRLKLWSRFDRADRLSRIGRYGVLFIGVRGTDAELKEELPRMTKQEDVLFLSCFHEKHAEIKEWVTDPGDPRFGLPSVYEMDFSAGNMAGIGQPFPSIKLPVHHTRILHIAEDLLDDEVFGRPALKRALNPIFDLQKIAASTGEGFWQVATRTLVGKIEGQIDQGDLEKLGEALEEIQHDLRRHFIGKGATLGYLDSTPPDPSGAGNFFIDLISAASGIPKRILLGSERGELASSQDERNFMGMIKERQAQHAEPNILRAFIDRMVSYGALPSYGKEEYEVVWPERVEHTEKEKAEANKANSEVAKNLTPVGGDPMDLIEITEDRDVILKSSATLEDEGFFDRPDPLALPPAEPGEFNQDDQSVGVPNPPADEGDATE